MVYIDSTGYKRHQLRALFDSGLQWNFITEELVSKLELPTSNIDMAIIGINGQFYSLKRKCDVNMNS